MEDKSPNDILKECYYNLEGAIIEFESYQDSLDEALESFKNSNESDGAKDVEDLIVLARKTNSQLGLFLFKLESIASIR